MAKRPIQGARPPRLAAGKGFSRRLKNYVERNEKLTPEDRRRFDEGLIGGEFGRAEIARIARLPERTARRVLNDVITIRLLASDTPRVGVPPVSCGRAGTPIPAPFLRDLTNAPCAPPNTKRKIMLSRGSEWRRWDLHVHTPDTALNDQFGGWEEYPPRSKPIRTSW